MAQRGPRLGHGHDLQPIRFWPTLSAAPNNLEKKLKHQGSSRQARQLADIAARICTIAILADSGQVLEVSHCRIDKSCTLRDSGTRLLELVRRLLYRSRLGEGLSKRSFSKSRKRLSIGGAVDMVIGPQYGN